MLTFQHLDSDGHRFLGFVLIDAESLSHHDLAEAAFAEGLAQGQPVVVGEEGQGGRGLGFSHKTNKQEAAQQPKRKS